MKTTTSTLLALVVLACASLVVACEGGGDGADALDATDTADALDATDVAADGDAIQGSDVPILERPLVASHACVEALPPTRPRLRQPRGGRARQRPPQPLVAGLPRAEPADRSRDDVYTLGYGNGG